MAEISREEKIRLQIGQRKRMYQLEEEIRHKRGKRLSKIHWMGIIFGSIILLLIIFVPKEPKPSPEGVDYGVSKAFKPYKNPVAEKLPEISIWWGPGSRPPRERVELWMKGHGSWYPNLKDGQDKRAFGKYRVGEWNEFFFYPDGRNGAEIRIPFRMTAEMISGSTRSQTIINIFDSKVEVLGEAIQDNGIEFKR